MSAGLPIIFDRVAFRYGEVAFSFDFVVEGGAVTALMGPSGSGKSTALSLIAGFERPSAGAIRIGGVDMGGSPPATRPVSMVFQENNLFGHLSVEQNVGLGRSPSLKLRPHDREAIGEALARVGLAGKGRRLPRELSGGERQRVALARILVRDRPVLLLDEPFASLGPALRDEMVELLGALHAERRMTVVFATHHPSDARKIAKTIVFLENGKVSSTGPTAHFFTDLAPTSFRAYVGDGGAAR